MGNQQFMLSNYSSASDLRDRLGFVEDPIWRRRQIMHSRMQQVIMMQSKFPNIVREAINDAKGLSPEQFFDSMDEAMERMIKPFFLLDSPFSPLHRIPAENERVGLDHNIDTEEEVEYAIRVFPRFLQTRDYSFWVPRDFKELPFFPLVTELAVERMGPSSLRTILYALKISYYEIKKRDRGRTDEDIRLHLNEVYHSFLIRLKQTCSASMTNIRIHLWDLIPWDDFFDEKIYRLLLDWEPTRTILEHDYMGPFLHMFFISVLQELRERTLRYGHDHFWTRFQTIFEAGMSHYPNELGFLFHKSFELGLDPNPQPEKPFTVACEVFGKERVIKLVNKNILRITKSGSYATRALFVLVASNPKIDVEGIYFILRLDPTVLVPATDNQSDLFLIDRYVQQRSLLVLLKGCCTKATSPAN